MNKKNKIFEKIRELFEIIEETDELDDEPWTEIEGFDFADNEVMDKETEEKLKVGLEAATKAMDKHERGGKTTDEWLDDNLPL